MPVETQIAWCRPDLSGRESEYVSEAMATGQIGPGGSFVDRFEQALAARVGARYAVTTSSGTSALQIALLAAGVRPGDEVLVPAWTFVATANAVAHVGAHPYALDVEPLHWQLDPDRLDEYLSQSCTRTAGATISTVTGRPVTAVVPVHLLGHPADLHRIQTIADAHGLRVVQDAAQALGATYRGHPIGADGLSAFSFNTNKLVTAGAGGAVVTNNESEAQHARYLINQARTHHDRYQHGHVGYNYRMSGLHAAVGLAQLERLDDLVAAKQRIHQRYRTGLDQPGLRLQRDASWASATHWFATLNVDADQFGITADQVRQYLAARSIQTGPSWTPLHQTGAHHGCARTCPVAEHLGRDSLHLPCSATLTTGDQQRVIDTILAAA